MTLFYFISEIITKKQDVEESEDAIISWHATDEAKRRQGTLVVDARWFLLIAIGLLASFPFVPEGFPILDWTVYISALSLLAVNQFGLASVLGQLKPFFATVVALCLVFAYHYTGATALPAQCVCNIVEMIDEVIHPEQDKTSNPSTTKEAVSVEARAAANG